VPDAPLVTKKLALIETFLRELRSEGHPDRIARDLRERRFFEHTLQIAIQATLDVASHIVSDERLGEPLSNRDLFERLGRHGWLDETLAQRLTRMAGFRNILVHGYADVDPAIVKDVAQNHLGDLEEFVAAVRARLAAG
jgi:uncharacterized protein YutE (UPF0331/DUF86 family)